MLSGVLFLLGLALRRTGWYSLQDTPIWAQQINSHVGPVRVELAAMATNLRSLVQIGTDLSTRLEMVKGLSPTNRLIVNPSDSLEAHIDNHKPICLDDEQYG
jgi:hypothetical protein